MAREGVRVRDDERGAFERLFHEHYDAVLAYALMRADVELAKDAAAQTFLVAWRRRDDMPEQVRPWLLGVTRRTLADMRRSATRRRSLVARVSTMGRAGGAAAAATAAHVDPADAVAEADGVVTAFLTLSESAAAGGVGPVAGRGRGGGAGLFGDRIRRAAVPSPTPPGRRV
jgi:RNA polymerase sigma-70 factor (ECF subfamily)